MPALMDEETDGSRLKQLALLKHSYGSKISYLHCEVTALLPGAVAHFGEGSRVSLTCLKAQFNLFLKLTCVGSCQISINAFIT